MLKMAQTVDELRRQAEDSVLLLSPEEASGAGHGPP